MTHRDHKDDETLDLTMLHAAWDGLPVPDATPALDESDAETQASVNWMVEAYAALQVPETVVPAMPSRPSMPGRTTPTDRNPRLALDRFRPDAMIWMRHAAAAAVFAALALALWWGRSLEQAGRGGPDPMPLTAQSEAPASDGDTHDIPRDIPGFREASAGPTGLVAVNTDHLEVSSGPVRLVLFTHGSSRAREPSQDLR